MRDYENHGACCKPQPDRIGKGPAAGYGNSQQGAQWFQEPAEARYKYAGDRPETGCNHRQRHRQPFRNILNGDSAGEWQGHR